MDDLKLNLGFAGDFSLGDFNSECDVMRIMNTSIEKFLDENDYNIFNFESTITENHDDHSCGLNVIDFIKENIPNPVASLANEHIMDNGKEGLKETLDVFDIAGIPYVGASLNNENYIKSVILGDRVKVAVLSVFDSRAVLKKKEYEGATCFSQTDLIKEQIASLREKADWVVMLFHGSGKDYASVPSPKTKEKLNAFLEMGCDIVVAHHPHAVQGYECVGKKMIFYSLGNFFYDNEVQRKYDRTEDGLLLRISFSKTEFVYEPLSIHLDRKIHFLVSNMENPYFVNLKDIDYDAQWQAERKRINKISAEINQDINADVKSSANSKTKSAKSNKTSVYTKIVSEQTGLSYEEADKKIEDFCNEYGITKEEYVTNKFYNSSKNNIAKKLELLKRKEQEYIERVTVATGWSKEKVVKEMDRVRDKFGISHFKYSNYRFFILNDEQIAQKLQRWNDNASNYRNYAIKESGWRSSDVRFHMNKVRTIYSFPSEYYALYKMWELSDEEIETYARRKDSNQIFKKYNIKEEAFILKDKELFDKNYKDYIKRKFWINKDTNYEEFLEFIDGLNAIFCKPVDSGGGQGTEKIILAEHKDTEKLYEYLMAKDRMLVEECVEQHPAIDAFAPGCVNTIRIVTVFKDGEVHVICASIRFGHKGVIDNFHSDGMVCAVDPDTGEVITDAIDRRGYSYKFHPVSKIRFKGFKIPNWVMVLKLASDAIQVQDGVNYVGWDIAICKDKAVIIEGNAAPDLVLIQAPFARENQGQKYRFEKFF